MDNSIVAMEESHLSDFEASASELGSLVQINSISIDISTSAAEEVEVLKHEHFSIRGFVAGMRKKNPKTCLPFASQGNDADPIDYLPPLLVPRFRWWQCLYCVPDIAMKKSTEEMVETGKSDAGTSSRQYIGNKLGLRDYADGEREKYPGRRKEKTNVMNKEAVSQRAMPETNPLQITERLNTASDDEHPSGTNDKPGNALSGNDGIFSALNPHKRKPKLRSLADILVEVNNTIGHTPKAVEITPSEKEPVLGPQIESDVVEDSRNPERKMKIIPEEEDREPLGGIFPGEAKRIRAPPLDAQRKCRRVETSDTESEGYVSMRLDQRTKPKTIKDDDIKRKTKQIHAENLQKCDASRETSFGKLGEMGACFRSIIYGQQMQKISNVSDKKIFEVKVDGDTAVPNGQGVLDLSLDSYRGIPDLNVEFNQKSDINMQEKHFSTVSAKRYSPLHKTLFFQDVSVSSSKGKTREGKNKSRIAKPPKNDSNIELGASDNDIPMEIVELLARNQHERALGNAKGHFNNNAQISHRSLHVDKHPDTINFPPAKRSGLTVPSRNTGFEQNSISTKFHPFRKSHPDMTKPDESQFRLFTSSKPAQLSNTQFPTPSSAELLWPPIRGHAHPFHEPGPRKNSLQPNSTGVHLFSNQRHKGKTVCDMNDGQDKRSMTKKGRIFSGSKSVGSLDPYLNDTIPAMQLLSLMDPQVVSGSSFELGTKGFLDKPFSPCTHHAQINGKENHNFLCGSFFPQSSHLKDFCGPRYGVYSSGESSRKVPSYLQGQEPLEVMKSKANPLKRSSGLTIRPARSDLALGVCTLNRNPADFSIPDSRNEFTISSKDLKPRKRNASKDKSRLVNGEGRQRKPRTKNDATWRVG